jgi:hypothetical protein
MTDENAGTLDIFDDTHDDRPHETDHAKFPTNRDDRDVGETIKRDLLESEDPLIFRYWRRLVPRTPVPASPSFRLPSPTKFFR